MTIQMYIELYVLLAATVLLAYLVSLWDVKRMRKDAEKQAEHTRIIELLKRSDQWPLQ